MITSRLFGRVVLVFAWYDLWVGCYWNRERRVLYVFPVPTLGVRIDCRLRRGLR